jgi:polysaccharide export outer membrane protein
MALQDGDTIFVPRAQMVYVQGYVNSIGPYPFESRMTVSKALALAGGVNQYGSDGRVSIKRMENGKVIEQKAKVDDLLQPQDIVIVGPRVF